MIVNWFAITWYSISSNGARKRYGATRYPSIYSSVNNNLNPKRETAASAIVQKNEIDKYKP